MGHTLPVQSVCGPGAGCRGTRLTREEKERVLGVSRAGHQGAGGHVSVLTRQPHRAGLPLPVGSMHSFIQHPRVPGAGDECSSAQDSWGPCPWPSQPRGQRGSTAWGAAWARRGLAFTRPRGAEWDLQPGPSGSRPRSGHSSASLLTHRVLSLPRPASCFSQTLLPPLGGSCTCCLRPASLPPGLPFAAWTPFRRGIC